ncbi:hypothetical protein E8E12_003391 [Didymella heteroderae]|uniref:Very-long-chain (3R)-3-hydroxyacyl-CoA dehydratase n=1 Tax=Didymella heteroderae TaxID=1769908 RepID=A0A9P5BZU1_9PLEO|nr:hypothetical protein E8E12_003391 [Didymella heteroderae]
MSEGAALEMSRFQSTLHQDDEEDLIDYCDSDAEAEKSNIQETTVTVAIEEIDIFADDVTQVDSSEQSDQPDHIYSNVEEPTGNSAGEQAIKSAEKSANILGAELAASPVGTSASTTIKTAEAATLIKDLNELLTNPDVRASLGLVEAGNALDLSFWADGLDFNLSLKLVGAAQIKACNYGAKCRNKDCTYDHGGADRTAIIAGKKPRKLCSVINTPASCAMGDACWFSHEALGVACADGDLRATCAKGMYCVYKHDDDEVVTSVKQTEQQQEQVVHGEEIKEPEASARNAPPIDSTAVTKTESAPLAPAPSATESPKEQVRRVKRGRELKDGAVAQPRILYLTAYNLLFAALWVSVGISALTHVSKGRFVLFENVEPRARWVQTLTLIEVVHAAIGLVKSPVGTTAIQVFTRVIQVWMIWHGFPASTAASQAFFVLVVAWAIADSIRYLYLALNLHGKAPRALVWLRYTMFYPLYPIGIGAEWWLMYRSVEPVGRISPILPPVFYFLLALYVPGAYTMFTYMVKQRKKTLGRQQKRA